MTLRDGPPQLLTTTSHAASGDLTGLSVLMRPASVRRMSDTPLSDVMAEHSDTRSPESYERFVALFRASVVGIVAAGPVVFDEQGRSVAGRNLTAGKTTHGDGLARVLAYADPEAALRNFGPRFNAGVEGEALLQMAVTYADCEGILLNSATDEISLIIDRATAQSLLVRPTTEASDHRL